jgi:hypothetical protein
MYAVKDDQPAVIERELDEEKGLDASGPRIRCPIVRLVAPQGGSLVVRLRQ